MPYVPRPIYNHEKNVLRMYFRLKVKKSQKDKKRLADRLYRQKDDWQTFVKFKKFKIATVLKVYAEIICLDIHVHYKYLQH